MSLNDRLKTLEEKIDVIIDKYNEVVNDNEKLRNEIALLEEANENLNREKQLVAEKIENILNKLP